jgi:outer membrane biosynthesis protein TonB
MLLLVTSASMAGTNASAEAGKPSETAKLLEKKIVYPHLAEYSNLTGTVEVELLLKENEQVEIISLSSEEKELAKSLQIQIKRLQKEIAKTMEPGTAQKFKFVFKM